MKLLIMFLAIQRVVSFLFISLVIIGITGGGYGLHLDATDSDSPLGAVVGIAGKYGRRGFMAGYDIETGKQKWQFDTIKSENWEGDFVTKTADGVKLPRDIAKEKESKIDKRSPQQLPLLEKI